MSEPKPVWKITPPLDPGEPFHVWHEEDGAWRDWAYQDDRHGDVPEAPTDYDRWRAANVDAIINAARLALPALAEVLRLWPFPAVDIEPVRELVRVLSELDNTSQ